jgi:hypothetical protein
MPPPDRLLLPVTAAGESTVVLAVPLLLPEFASGVLELAVAVLLIIEPAGTFGATATVTVKTEVPAVNEGFEQEMVPVSPASGELHDHPLTPFMLTKLVPAGNVSAHEALLAASGPLLVTVIV